MFHDGIFLLLLLMVANGAPILVQRLMGRQCNWPVDFGITMGDGYRLLGESKTWRGIFCAVISTAIASLILGQGVVSGIIIAILAMLGDLCSSFAKRRLGKPPSSMLPLVDQIPESLLPSLVMMKTFQLNLTMVGLLVIVFIILELLLSRVLYKLGIRTEPY